MKLFRLGSAATTPTSHDDTKHSDGPNAKNPHSSAAHSVSYEPAPALFDAIVDGVGTLTGHYTTIQAAINAGAITIFVQAGTRAGFTILSTDAVTRIIGETPGSAATVGVRIITDVTIQKVDVVLEQMTILATLSDVTTFVQAARVTFFAVVWQHGVTGRSTISVNGSGNDLTFVFCQGRGAAAVGPWVTFTANALRPKWVQCYVTGYTGAAPIIEDAGFAVTDGQLSACSFVDNANTDFLVKLTNTLSTMWEIAGNSLTQFDGGGLQVYEGVVTGNMLMGVASAGKAIVGSGDFAGNFISDCDTGIELNDAGGVSSVAGNVMDSAVLNGIVNVAQLQLSIANNVVAAAAALDLGVHGGQSFTVLANIFQGTVINVEAQDVFLGNSDGTNDLGTNTLVPRLDNSADIGSSVKRYKQLNYYESSAKEQGLTLANGNNNDVATSGKEFLRITGPTAAFTVTGLANGYDGKLVTLFNDTAQVMTVSFLNTASVVANRILTGASSSLTAADGDLVFQQRALVTLCYSAANSRWLVVSCTPERLNVEKAFTAANGNNNNINIGAIEQPVIVRITGPTAAFAVTGIANPRAGKRVILLNATTQDLTVAHESASSTAALRINTLHGDDVTVLAGGQAELIYSTTDARWILLSALPLDRTDVASSAVTTVANNAAEAVLATDTIPANMMVVGRALRIRARGVFSSDNTGQTLELRVRWGGLGGVLLGTTGVITLPAIVHTNRGWVVDFDIICVTVGAAGTMECQGLAQLADTAITTIPTDMENAAVVAALDTTIAQALVLTADWSAADPAQTISIRQFEVEVLN